MPRHKRQLRYPSFERIESRRLLAVDLAIEVDFDLAEVRPGDEVAYRLHVSNLGSGDGTAAQVTSDATAFLEDVTWSRETTFRRKFDSAALHGFQGLAIDGEGAPDGFSSMVASAGDVNGDGIDDLLLGAATAEAIRTGVGEAYVIFGAEGATGTISINALDGTNGFALRHAEYGITSVSGAGDVNSDGFNDLIIGALQYSTETARLNDGISYVVFGSGSGLGPEVDLTKLDGQNGFAIRGYPVETPFVFTSPGATGFSMSGAGDVNGDGIDDILIGSRGVEYGAAAYVVYGSKSGSGAAFELSSLYGENGFRLYDGLNRGRPGYRVSDAGDVNGDGIDDIVIGTSAYSGQAYLVFGSKANRPSEVDLRSLDGDDGFVFRNDWSGHFQGQVAVSAAGDVNGDGFDDVMIGVPLTDAEGQRETGEAYLLFGTDQGFEPTFHASSIDGSNGFTMHAAKTFRYSGMFLTDLGDVNGDGLDDVLLSSRLGRPGEAHLVFGSSSGFDTPLDLLALDGSNGLTIGYPREVSFFHDYTHEGIGGAGDFNHDGKQDLVFARSGSTAFVMFGSEAPNPDRASGTGPVNEWLDIASGTTVTYIVKGTIPTTAAGTINPAGEVAAADGQVDADPQNNMDAKSVVILREVDLAVAFSEVMAPVVAGESLTFEFTITNTGPTEGSESSITSEFSRLLEDVSWSRTITGAIEQHPAEYDLSRLAASQGFSVGFALGAASEATGIGDINGDGLEDIAISEARLNGIESQAVYVIFGTDEEFPLRHRPKYDGVDGFMIRGKTGVVVSPGGDINGDGLDDFIVGGVESAWAYVIFGSRQFESSLNVGELNGQRGFEVVHGNDEGRRFRVSDAGDVNDDGFDDFVIHANRGSGGSLRRETFVVFGQSTFAGQLDLVATVGRNGVWVDGEIGHSASLGDVNGDGVDDLALATTADFGQLASDTVVVFGRREGFPPIVSLDSLSEDLGFRIGPPTTRGEMVGWGSVVAAAGDVNADGIGDILVGADANAPVDPATSGVSIILGRSDGRFGELERVELTRLVSGGFPRMHLDSIGDINRDGIDDVLVGTIHESYVVFGSRGILNYDFALNTLDGTHGFVLKHPEIPGKGWGVGAHGMGDFNGDGFGEFILLDRNSVELWYGPKETESLSGTGDIDHTLDIGIGAVLHYAVTGTVGHDASDAVTNRVSVDATKLRTDTEPENNVDELTFEIVSPITGDIDLDGVVGFSDFLVLSANFGAEQAGGSEGDLDGDGKVLFSDFLILSENFGAGSKLFVE